MQLALYDDCREGMPAVAVLVQRPDAADEAAVLPCHRSAAPVVNDVSFWFVDYPGTIDRADVDTEDTRHTAGDMDARSSQAVSFRNLLVAGVSVPNGGDAAETVTEIRFDASTSS